MSFSILFILTLYIFNLLFNIISIVVNTFSKFVTLNKYLLTLLLSYKYYLSNYSRNIISLASCVSAPSDLYRNNSSAMTAPYFLPSIICRGVLLTITSIPQVPTKIRVIFSRIISIFEKITFYTVLFKPFPLQSYDFNNKRRRPRSDNRVLRSSILRKFVASLWPEVTLSSP